MEMHVRPVLWTTMQGWLLPVMHRPQEHDAHIDL